MLFVTKIFVTIVLKYLLFVAVLVPFAKHYKIWYFLYKIYERTSIKPLLFLIHILLVNVYDIAVTFKSFHVENSYYGFHSQSGRPDNAKIAFVATLAKPNQKYSLAFYIKQHCLPHQSYHFLSVVEWIKRLLLIQ